jgi:hypothetical protein
MLPSRVLTVAGTNSGMHEWQLTVCDLLIADFINSIGQTGQFAERRPAHDHQPIAGQSSQRFNFSIAQCSKKLGARPLARSAPRLLLFCRGRSDRPGAHADTADLQQLLARCAVAGLHCKALGGQRVDIGFLGHVAVGNAFSDARGKRCLRARAMLGHHFPHALKARWNVRAGQGDHAS